MLTKVIPGVVILHTLENIPCVNSLKKEAL